MTSEEHTWFGPPWHSMVDIGSRGGEPITPLALAVVVTLTMVWLITIAGAGRVLRSALVGVEGRRFGSSSGAHKPRGPSSIHPGLGQAPGSEGSKTLPGTYRKSQGHFPALSALGPQMSAARTHGAAVGVEVWSGESAEGNLIGILIDTVSVPGR